MQWTTKVLIGVGLVVFIMACTQNKKATQPNVAFVPDKLACAQEFTINKSKDVTQLKIFTSNKDRNSSETFNLVADDALKATYANSIKVPCKKIVCLSSTQLAYFFALDDIDNISAINSSRFLRHDGMRAKVESGEVKQIGKEGNFNLEVIAAIDPDVIFVSPFKRGGFDALRNLGIPLVPMAAYNENTPLGRAEWLKMIALFVGEEEKADDVFNGIASRYNHLKQLTADVKDRPTVFSGKLRSGSWYVPGGNSFYAHYFRDAGADYIIKDDKQAAYPLSFETIYQKASTCDFWRIVHPEKSGFTLFDLGEQDSRYKDFKAFTNHHVLLCNIREKPYYEQAAVKPDVLLADYIHYFHPELQANYKPYFYERLK